jgi:hypothetical protein
LVFSAGEERTIHRLQQAIGGRGGKFMQPIIHYHPP